MVTDSEPIAPHLPRIEPPEGSGWQLHSPYGAQRFKDGPDGRLVRLADVVRWLMQARETSFANAVRAICAPLEGDTPPLLYRLDPMEDAAPDGYATEWFKYLSGYDDLHSLPPQVANARAAARDVRATWLMMPGELSRLVNGPGFPAVYDETKESPFEFSQRTGRAGGPKDLAVAFAVAHELWGWGAVVAPASGIDLGVNDTPAALTDDEVTSPQTLITYRAQFAHLVGDSGVQKRPKWTERQRHHLLGAVALCGDAASLATRWGVTAEVVRSQLRKAKAEAATRNQANAFTMAFRERNKSA